MIRCARRIFDRVQSLEISASRGRWPRLVQRKSRKTITYEPIGDRYTVSSFARVIFRIRLISARQWRGARLETGRNVPLQDAHRNRYPVAGPLASPGPRGKGGELGKKDNGGTQREFEESWRNSREGAYVCARMGRRMTPLRLARSDCPIVMRDRRDRFHLWSRMVMIPRRRRKREWRGSHRSSGSGRKWVNRAVRQDEELRVGIRI